MDKKQLNQKLTLDRANTLAICSELIKIRHRFSNTSNLSDEKALSEATRTLKSCLELAEDTIKT